MCCCRAEAVRCVSLLAVLCAWESGCWRGSCCDHVHNTFRWWSSSVISQPLSVRMLKRQKHQKLAVVIKAMHACRSPSLRCYCASC